MMKTIRTSFFALLAAAAVSVAHAGDYLTNFEAGKEKAKAEKKSLLVKFTGSDWCPPCIKLDKEVFSKSSFKKAVEKDFVVVVLDFPQKKKLPKAEAAANQKVKEKYKPEGYPTVMMMDYNGKVLKRYVGYQNEGAKAYLKKINDSIRAMKFQ